MSELLKQQVAQVMELLAAGKYSDLEALTNRVRLTASEMSSVITNYGRRLITPPAAAYDLMDVVNVRHAKPPRWSVTMPLWTLEEGRSDLSIELSIIQTNEGLKVELDDIHVL